MAEVPGKVVQNTKGLHKALEARPESSDACNGESLGISVPSRSVPGWTELGKGYWEKLQYYSS